MSTTYLGHERRFSTVKVRAGAALLVFLLFVLVTASGQAQSSFVYTNNNEIPNTVTAFSVGFGGTLMTVPGSPFMTGGDGSGLFVASNTAAATMRKRFLYVSNNGTNDISGFSIDTTTGALTPVPGSPFDNGPFRNGGAPVCDINADPSGKLLLLADCENSLITVFSIDASSGALTNIKGSPFPVAAKPIGGGSPSNLAITH